MVPINVRGLKLSKMSEITSVMPGQHLSIFVKN